MSFAGSCFNNNYIISIDIKFCTLGGRFDEEEKILRKYNIVSTVSHCYGNHRLLQIRPFRVLKHILYGNEFDYQLKK